MNEPNVKCRVCWEDKETKGCLALSTKWGIESTKSIKEIILLCVPWMSIEENSFICKPCLWQLKFTYNFVERCLKTENILNEANNKSIGPLSLEDIFEKSLKNGNKIQIIFENPESPRSQPDHDSNEAIEETLQESAENAQTINIQDNLESVQGSDENEKIIDFQIDIPEDYNDSEHNYCIKKGTHIVAKTVASQKNYVEPDVLNESEDVRTENDLADSNYTSNEIEKENICNETNGLVNSESGILSDSSPGNLIAKQVLNSSKKTISTMKKVTQVPKSLDPPVKNELTDLLDIAPIDIWYITSQSEITKEQQDDLIIDGVNILNMSKDPTKKKRTIFLSRDLRLSYFDCFRCHDKFKSRSDYLDHLHLHRKGKTPGSAVYTCSICSETFGFDIDFRSHTRTFHSISNPHLCSKCNRRFRSLKELKDHQKQFKDYEKCTYKCKRCDKAFYKLSSLQHHENDVKDAPACNYQKCRVCFQKFTREEFKVHSKEVHGNYLCQECGKSFHEAQSLWAHRRNVHNHIESMCHECGRILCSPKALLHHSQTVHGSKSYMCDKCSRTFATVMYLRRHIRKVHTDKSQKQKWKCEKCGKEYFSKESLHFHERMVHMEMKRFTCHICNEGFLRNDYYQRHLRNHTRYSKNTCPICRRCFPFDWRLEYHIHAGHDENGNPLEKPNEYIKAAKSKKFISSKSQLKCICKICNKVLGNQVVLNLHYRSHLKLRKYKCNYCDVTFQTKMSLSRHVKLHTDPNFQFSCNICHAYKSSSADLESHMLEVHKDKKYKCKMCSEAFGRKHLLLDHEATVHQEDNYKKELILNILEQDHIFISPKDDQSVKTKSKKLLEVDINKVYDDLVNKPNTSGVYPGTSQDINSGEEFQTNIQGNSAPGRIPGNKNVIILSNEYQSMEAERACKIIEEENRLAHVYRDYKD